MKPKRLISLLVAVCMMITMLPLSAVTAFAADTSSSTEQEIRVGDYKYAYKVNADGATITDFLGPVDSANNGPYDITIPTMLGDHPVTAIGVGAFAGTGVIKHPKKPELCKFCRQIKVVTIPKGITSIGESAFESPYQVHTALTDVTIDADITSMGSLAFAYCSALKNVTLGDGVREISDYAFAWCEQLEHLTLGNGIQTIGERAFNNCFVLDNVTLPASLTSIGECSFLGCKNLHQITIPEKVTHIGDYAFGECAELGSATIKGPVTSIGKCTFTVCSKLKTVELPESLTTIGDSAFCNCDDLDHVVIPDNVTHIKDRAFVGCETLSDLTLGSGLTEIGNDAFGGCKALQNIQLPAHLKTINDYAFSNCANLSKVTMPDGVETIGKWAFSNCENLDSITLPDSVTTTGSITLPDSVTTIGEYAFYSCKKIGSITIPKNVTTIEPNTFSYCLGLKDITLPAGLTSFKDDLSTCTAGYLSPVYEYDEEGNPIIDTYVANGAIYYKNYKAAADALLADNDDNSNIDDNHNLRKRNFLYLCKVTFDAKGGKTDYPEVPVYKTEKITDTKANDLTAIHDPTRAGYKFTGWYTEDGKDSKLFNVKDTAIMEDITLHAGWEFDPDALVCHPLTVTGGTVTVKYDGSDVTSKLRSTDAATGQKTYYVPEGAEVTVTLDKTLIPKGKVFDGWSTSLPTGQDYKAESITFSMSNDVNVSAKYRDAAADHTHDTAACRPLTVTGGIVTVKNGDKDVTDTLTVTTDETTGKKTYSVPDGATVTVTLDKTLIPEGMVFDIWSTGKFSLPLGQDYKAESITFTMNSMSSDADIAAQYRDATIEDDGPNVLGTAAIIGTAAVGTAVLGYQAYSLGAEFAGKLMALPYFPSNRSALAMMLWEDAGKPMPESELLYPDVGQEERDMDLQHAARWAMENELIPDLNDEGTAPEEMKFFPANPVSKLDVLNAWQKAQELKNN